jgi:hypothetical protein
MAESESTPTSEAQNEALSDASAEALVPAETWTQEGEMATPAPAEAEQTPFRDDQRLFFEGALIRNELADAQADPEAARGLAARHWSRLLYPPSAPWRGRTPYPQVNLPKPDKQTK